MDVALRGSLPGATTAGILLLTRARQFGFPLKVAVIGDPRAFRPVPGPALVYAPVLASCGVGREYGQGATVIIPGPPRAPLWMTVVPHGVSGWFPVDRTGQGAHAATRAYVRMSRDARVPARHLSKELRRAMEALGLAPEPAILDVLFGASTNPLTRISVGLRAGRALAGGRGQPITRYVTEPAVRDPLSPAFEAAAFDELLKHGGIEWILDGLSSAVRDRAEDWVDRARMLAAEDGGRDLELLYALAELGSHLVQLPAHSMLPPLGAAEDAVAVGLARALNADGHGNVYGELTQTFLFLGGRYEDDAEHAHVVDEEVEPDGEIERLQWFCSAVRRAYRSFEELWRPIVDPPQ